MDMYRDIILDHYKHPRHFGTMEKPDKTANASNTTCGDSIRMDLVIGKDKNKTNIIKDIRFSGVGCAISQAAASMLTEEIIGKPVEYVTNMKSSDVIALLGTELTPSRVKCATLPLEVLVKALVQ
jgi:nitrogen fixation protein NifU and related proteins